MYTNKTPKNAPTAYWRRRLEKLHNKLTLELLVETGASTGGDDRRGGGATATCCLACVAACPRVVLYR